MQAISKWTQNNVGKDDRDRKKQGEVRSTEPSQNSNCRGTPDRGCRVKPADIRTVFKDYARAEKADARDHVRRNPAASRWISIEQKARHHECRGARRHESIGPSPCHALPPLPFEANNRSQQECGNQPLGKQESHGHLIPF
jgi:hypothetical protein